MKYLTRQHKQGSRTYWDMHSQYPQIQTANYWKSKTLREEEQAVSCDLQNLVLQIFMEWFKNHYVL